MMMLRSRTCTYWKHTHYSNLLNQNDTNEIKWKLQIYSTACVYVSLSAPGDRGGLGEHEHRGARGRHRGAHVQRHRRPPARRHVVQREEAHQRVLRQDRRYMCGDAIVWMLQNGSNINMCKEEGKHRKLCYEKDVFTCLFLEMSKLYKTFKLPTGDIKYSVRMHYCHLRVWQRVFSVWPCTVVARRADDAGRDSTASQHHALLRRDVRVLRRERRAATRIENIQNYSPV